MLKENMCYAIVNVTSGKSQDDIYCAENLAFKAIPLSGPDLIKLEKQISEWEIHDKYEWTEEDFVHDVQKSDSGTKIIQLMDLVSIKAWKRSSTDLVGGYLLENGEFIGVILSIEQITSFGMACSREKEFGIILTDGKTYGKTNQYYTHCSTEQDCTSSHYYSLIKKSKQENK